MLKQLKNINFVGVADSNRKVFDKLIPLPNGTSYNSYLVKGKKFNVLLDTVDPSKTDEFIDNLGEEEKVDFIIAHHAEQDHSGCLPAVLKKYPQAKIITSKKCEEFLIDLLHIEPSKFKIISDGEEFDIGGKTFQFVFTPWVHWPETFCTYLVEDKVLFSCDFFGSHFADNLLEIEKIDDILTPAKRYYAEIMMPFRIMVQKNIEKVEKLDIEIIAPSHGPVYKDPKTIIDAYKKWNNGQPKNLVLIPYVSMHGSTKKMVLYAEKKLKVKGVEVIIFDLSTADIGELAVNLVDAATIIVGASTVLGGPHPYVLFGAYLASILKPKAKYISVLGSYGWGGKTLEIIKEQFKNPQFELLDPVNIKGDPREEDFEKINLLAEKIIAKHTELGII